ncbi:MAG: nitrilase family protein [Bacteroidetes bacterium]|nr:nitrilase family protein [Bacteroidota bacterium]
MTKELKITLVQTTIHWQDRAANLNMLNQKLSILKKQKTDLIVLPEMFTTGFTMNAEEQYDTMQGETVERMLHWASTCSCHVMGSVIIKEKNKFYNRLLIAAPNKVIQHYDKRHLFSLAGEEKTYTPGKSKLILEINGWKILPLICYDLRFGVFSANTFQNGIYEYDAAIYVANWPDRRRKAWVNLGMARAIENQSYTVMVNRVGKDANGLSYKGYSACFDYMGEKISSLKPGVSAMETVTLSYKKLYEFRKQFAFLNDAAHFQLK